MSWGGARWGEAEALGVLIEPFFKVIEPEAHPHSSFNGWIDVAVAMREPTVESLEHFLSTCLRNCLECLGRLEGHGSELRLWSLQKIDATRLCCALGVNFYDCERFSF